MSKRAVLLVALLLAACQGGVGEKGGSTRSAAEGAGGTGAPEKGSEPELNPKVEAAQVLEQVEAGMKAGFERFDYEAYAALFAEDAVMIGRRSEDETKYEVRLSAAQFLPCRELRFAMKEPAGLSLEMQLKSSRIAEDGRLELEVDTTMTGPEESVERVHEIYLLRQVDGAWKIEENTWWLLEMSVAGETSRFPAAYLEMDSALADVTPGTVEHAGMLTSAGRVAEAREAFRALATDTAGEDLWSFLAVLELQMGDAKAAAAAMRKAGRDVPERFE